MTASVLVCGAVFDGVPEELRGPTEILVRDGLISELGDSVHRPNGGEAIDLSERTVSPGFIDTHVHLTMDASNLAQQTLESSAAKALRGLSLAREYLGYGFTTLRDLGSMDPEFPTVDPRNALNAGLVQGPRLIVAATSSAPRRATATYAASTPHAGSYRCPRSPTARTRFGGWAPRARLRLGPDQDGQCRRLLQRRRRSRAPHLVRRRGHRDGHERRLIHRADDADDPGRPRGAARRHTPLPGHLEIQPR